MSKKHTAKYSPEVRERAVRTGDGQTMTPEDSNKRGDSILSEFQHFSFTILPYPLEAARQGTIDQGLEWGTPFDVEVGVPRDVRCIYLSADGPVCVPAVRKAIFLTEVDGPRGVHTLFVGSPADGYSSMVFMLSKRARGVHLVVEVSARNSAFPRNAIGAIESNRMRRTVYSMLDSNGWEFHQAGDALPFEQPNRYTAKRKKDRLTVELIESYLNDFGYGDLSRGFWLSPGGRATVLCQRDFRLWNPTTSQSGSEPS